MTFDRNSPIVNRGIEALEGRIEGDDEVIREVVFDILQAALEPEENEQAIHKAFYDLTVKERDYERLRYDNLSDLIRTLGESHGFHWEPDCVPRSMLAKLSNRIELQQRRLSVMEQALRGLIETMEQETIPGRLSVAFARCKAILS